MAVKFHCTKCDRRFVEFGVSRIKAGDGCEDCKGEHLEQVGFSPAQASTKKKPALKRKRKAAAKKPAAVPPEDAVPDLDTVDTPGADVDIDPVAAKLEPDAT